MQRSRRVYLDSSAYLSLLLDEEGAFDILHDVAGSDLLSSVLLILEVRRSLVRLARARGITSDHYDAAHERVAVDLQRFVLRDLTLDLCDAHPLPAVATPRTLDLVHLRTALWFHREQPIDRFLTKDDAQRAAARELGLPV